MSNVHDKAGNPRVAVKKKPEELTRTDPQLRLCHPETTPSTAVDWVKELAELHDSHPAERVKLQEREIEVFSDLAVIIAFVYELSPLISMPSFPARRARCSCRDRMIWRPS